MPASSMTGARKWRFTSGLDVAFMEATDFWLDYRAEAREDGQVLLGVTLRSCWEHSDFSSPAGIARRFYIEERLRVLTHTFTGKKGTLEIDYGTAQAKAFAAITFKGVSPELARSNELLKFDLAFEYPLGSASSIARTISFAGHNLSAENFLVEYSKDDPTVFKEVFRAAPVRVPAGPGLKRLIITAIKKSVSGADALAKRQAGEAEVKGWAWDRLGNAGALILDGTNNLGTCHLREVRASDLNLPDAVIFELVFVTGYAQ